MMQKDDRKVNVGRQDRLAGGRGERYLSRVVKDD